MDTGASGGVGLLRRALGIVALNLVLVTGLVPVTGAARAGDVVGQSVSVSKHASRGSVEIVEFPDRQHMPISVVRGTDPAGSPRVRREIMTFGTEAAHQVAVFRGSAEPASRPGEDAAAQKVLDEIGSAGAARRSAATLRGGALLSGSYLANLVSPGGEDQFLRIADAVHGVESGYGTDSRMWRLYNINGPQGPMQVSAAAALDVGGGNRFDVYENILLGRFYLARMLRKYGSWSDALAAYNWGPANVDQWIARGRNSEQLPAETTRYIERVLRRALFGSVGGTAPQRM